MKSIFITLLLASSALAYGEPDSPGHAWIGSEEYTPGFYDLYVTSPQPFFLFGGGGWSYNGELGGEGGALAGAIPVPWEFGGSGPTHVHLWVGDVAQDTGMSLMPSNDNIIAVYPGDNAPFLPGQPHQGAVYDALNWGAGLPSAGVPEPSTLMLALIFIGAMHENRRRS